MRLNAAGSADLSFSTAVTFNSQINDILVLADGKILGGGAFNLSSSRLARLNSDGTHDSTGSVFNGTVLTIAQAANGKTIIGGEFSQPRRTVARLNENGTFDNSFNPMSGSACDHPYKDIAQPNGKILVAGDFSFFNVTIADGLLRLNDNGSVDTAFEIFSEQTDGIVVSDLTLQLDGKFLASFHHYIEPQTVD